MIVNELYVKHDKSSITLETSTTKMMRMRRNVSTKTTWKHMSKDISDQT